MKNPKEPRTLAAQFWPKKVMHADWSKEPGKRWLAVALRKGSSYRAGAPKMVKEPSQLLEKIRAPFTLAGFDFPIGLPAFYASRARIASFRKWLSDAKGKKWPKFFSVAEKRSEISLSRPFYPYRPGGTKRSHLVSRLGATDFNELRRICEREHVGRRAACPLFWTLSAQQVGKAAIAGWRELLIPLLDDPVRLWPFDGGLCELLSSGQTVIVETYPAEYYRWFSPNAVKGKTIQENRKKVAHHLLQWAGQLHIELEAKLEASVKEGFPEGDDAFDAIVGLFGMLAVVLGQRAAGDPSDEQVRNVEGWILGRPDERGNSDEGFSPILPA